MNAIVQTLYAEYAPCKVVGRNAETTTVQYVSKVWFDHGGTMHRKVQQDIIDNKELLSIRTLD